MFNKDFYPTPREVVLQMISGIDLKGKRVLDPSAGSGNICEVVKEFGAKVYSCEINNDLAEIVKTKSKFLGYDFLSIKSDEISHIELIIMNPPFSADEKHILHAFEVSPPGTQIVSLCNAETLKNTFSRNRVCLKTVVDNHGTRIDIGNVFNTEESERKTNVDVSLINIYKPGDGSDKDLEGYFSMEEQPEGGEKEGLIGYDEVTSIVQRYVVCVKMFDSVQEKAKEINKLIQPFNETYGGGIEFLCNNRGNGSGSGTIMEKSDFKKQLQKKAWRLLFYKLDLDRYITRAVRDKINRYCEMQENVPFTVKNVWRMLEVIVKTSGNTFNSVLIDVFERVTKHYHENRYGVEGWKTNDQWLVNKKFILPNCVTQSYSGISTPFYSNETILDDFQKSLCSLTGKDYNNVPSLYAFVIDNKGFGEWYEWGFFKVKFFKKRTAHCIFLDEKVWELFNRKVAEAKGWQLPETTTHEYRKKKDGVETYK